MNGMPITRQLIELVLSHDPAVVKSELLPQARAMWRVTVSVQGRPVELILDNGINEIYVQVLISIDMDHVVLALRAMEPFGTAGLVLLGENLFIRAGMWAEFSNMHALTNTLQAAALAFLAYQDSVRANLT